MIKHNPPAFWQLAKEEGEFAVRLVAFAFQTPAP
jgi:hypothetical protein